MAYYFQLPMVLLRHGAESLIVEYARTTVLAFHPKVGSEERCSSESPV
jgi:hypothetical protein